MGSQFLLWLQAARATSQSGIFLLWQKLISQKIAIFKCKNVFSIGYVRQLAIWMHPSNACLLSLTKTKRKTLLKPGHCLGDPFIVLVLNLMIQRRWKKTSLDRAQAQQKGSPMRCPSFRRRSNGKQFPIANGEFLSHLNYFNYFPFQIFTV